MSKTIMFDGAGYIVDETLLATTKEEFKTHLTSNLNGTGATIELDGVSYNVDANKLAVAKADLVNHINNIGVEASQDVVIYDGLVPNLDYHMGSYYGSFPSLADKLAENKLYRVIVSTGDFYLEFEKPYCWSDPDNAMQIHHEYDQNPYVSSDNLRLYFNPEDSSNTLYFHEHCGIYNAVGEVSEISIKIVELASAEGCKLVTINGTQYSIDTDQLANAISELHGGISGISTGKLPRAPGLYRTGTNILAKSWDKMISDNSIKVVDGVVSCTDGNIAGDLVLSNDVTTIESYGFAYYNVLTGIEIPDSVTIIRDDAFADCEKLSSVTIPDSVTSIGKSAFYNCHSLAYVKFGSGLTNIEKYAFEKCINLTSIEIPAGVTSIGMGAFSYCSGVTSIIVDPNNTVYHSAGNCLIETETNTLMQGFKSSVIPESVTTIGHGAFSSYNSTSITIPDNVTTLSDYAFSGCDLISVAIPDSVTSIGANAFHYSSNLTSVHIGSGVTVIPTNAFRGCSNLTNVTLGSNVTTIEQNVFEGCDNLVSIEIPVTVTNIGGTAFRCKKLTNITFAGTIAQWNAITKAYHWNYSAPATYVQCSDGQVAL